MGKNNSSKTRVAPVFEGLLKLDPTGSSWLPKLLSLPHGGAAACIIGRDCLLECCRWDGHGGEKALPPPASLLRWLAQNVEHPSDPRVWRTSEYTRQKREALLRRDPDTIAEALRALERPPCKAGWYVLEGPSYPDVYLETPDIIVVIEGKRTEGKTTTRTLWMPGRRQMWRHIDCAWERRGNKRVCGLLIVEQDGEATQFAEETLSADAIHKSLPHRSPDEVLAITECFLGAITWQSVCEEFGLSMPSL